MGLRTLKPPPAPPDIDDDDDLGEDIDETLVAHDDENDELWDSGDDDELERAVGVESDDVVLADEAARPETAPTISPADPGRLLVMDLAEIVPDPDQPRLEVDDELAASIAAQGVLQPILVRTHPEMADLYMIVDGERRYRGALKAGIDRITVRLVHDAADTGDRLLRQVTMNEGKRLAPMEEAKAWKRIMDAKGWTIVQLAAAIGRAKSTISDRLALLEAPLPFHKYFLDGTLTAAAAPIVRRFAGVSDKVAEQMIQFAKSGPGWDEAVHAGKPVPLKVVEDELTLAVTDEMPLLVDGDPVAARYNGPSVVIKQQRFALDPDLYDAADKAYEDERRAAEPAAATTGAPAKKEKRAPDPYVAKQRAEAKRAKEKSELRATQIQLLAPKLPTKLDRPWGLFLVEYLVRELTTDSQRHAVKVLGITPPKMGTQGFQFDKAILKHAESLKADQLLPLAFTLLLAGDCYVSSYGGNEAKRIAAAAKLLKVDLKKLKPPAPVAPKRIPGKPDFMQPQQPDAALAAIVGKGPMPRTEITVKLWAYIKKNGLQDAKERRMINADDKLAPVFNGKKRVSMFEMTKVVNKHIIGPKGGTR